MHWNGPMRKDEVHVTSLDTHNRWVIVRPNGQIAYNACPCCDMVMKSERIAKLVADTVMPPLGEAYR